MVVLLALQTTNCCDDPHPPPPTIQTAVAVIDYGRHQFQFQRHKNSSFKTLINKAMRIGKGTSPLKDEIISEIGAELCLHLRNKARAMISHNI